MANYGVGIGAFADGFSKGMSIGQRFRAAKQEWDAEKVRTNELEAARKAREDAISQETDRLMSVNQQGQYLPNNGTAPEVAQSFPLPEQPSIQSTDGIGNFGSMGSMGSMGGMGTPAAASSGGGASSGIGSMAASAGPWAALAATIAVNEHNAKEGGYRRSGGDYAKDLATGAVAYQDVDQRWAPKLFGEEDKTGLGGDMRAATALGSFQPKKALEHLTEDSSIGKLLKKIF